MKKKRDYAVRGVVLLAAVCCLLSVASCARAPKADDLRADVIALVEASYEINEVFLGAGLPVLDRNAEEYADLYAFYAPATVHSYNIVDVSHSKFASIEEIKRAAALVYSPDLLENNLYVNGFMGYAADGIAMDARFQEDGTYLFQSVAADDLLDGRLRVYDYSTLRVVRPSSSSAVYVTMNSWYAGHPETATVKRLRLVRTDAGWRLDSFTV